MNQRTRTLRLYGSTGKMKLSNKNFATFRRVLLLWPIHHPPHRPRHPLARQNLPRRRPRLRLRPSQTHLPKPPRLRPPRPRNPRVTTRYLM